MATANDTEFNERMVYLDHHATTPVDPQVLAVMMQFFETQFGNPGSVTHELGRRAKQSLDRAVHDIATTIGATDAEIIITSGSTESCNLAINGLAERQSHAGHIVSVKTEHAAVLDPLKKLEKRGHSVTYLDVVANGESRCGFVDLEQFENALRSDTFLVSIMLANNEIGVIQPIRQIAEICHSRGIVLHSDATQAIGRIPVNVDELGVDLMSFSAHKFYGPKGVGGLFVRRRGRRIRLAPQILGGGQQQGIRSGTLNVGAVAGMAAAIKQSVSSVQSEATRLSQLRSVLFSLLETVGRPIVINGPGLAESTRLPNNLNIEIVGIDGQMLMNNMPEIALSSGAACSAASPLPSHVLAAIGLNPDQIRCSLRFGLGKTNTEDDIRYAADRMVSSIRSIGG